MLNMITNEIIMTRVTCASVTVKGVSHYTPWEMTDTAHVIVKCSYFQCVFVNFYDFVEYL